MPREHSLYDFDLLLTLSVSRQETRSKSRSGEEEVQQGAYIWKRETQLSEVDWVLVRMGVSGLKAALDKYYSYGGGRSRRPLLPVQSSAFSGERDEILQRVVNLENSL